MARYNYRSNIVGKLRKTILGFKLDIPNISNENNREYKMYQHLYR